MVKRICIVMLAAVVVSCNKSEPAIEQTESSQSGEITYTIAEADWTRGTSVDSADKIPSIGVFAVRNSDDLGAAATQTKSLYIDHLSAVLQDNGYWHFEPSLYYPAGETLKFFAYSPYQNSETNGVSTTFDLDDEEMTISYYAPTIDGRDQPDLLVASGIGNQNSSGELTLDYTHALTKITLSAMLSGTGTSAQVTNADGDLVDPEYYITRFTMYNIATGGTLTCSMAADGTATIGDSSNASGPWIIDQNTRNTIITSNAYMLPDPTGDYDGTDSNSSTPVMLTSSSYENIMGGQALFMLPQRIEALPSSIAAAPTIYITIYEAVTDTYYRTSEMSLPTPSNAGFQMGQHINLQFAFDIDASGVVIDMSLTPVVNDWTEFDVEVDIDPNIYILLEEENITTAADGNTATVTLYTNSAVTPTVSTSLGDITVSGTAAVATTGSNTIADATLTAYTLTIDTSSLEAGETTGTITVVAYADAANTDAETAAGKPDETTITKIFNLTINKAD